MVQQPAETHKWDRTIKSLTVAHSHPGHKERRWLCDADHPRSEYAKKSLRTRKMLNLVVCEGTVWESPESLRVAVKEKNKTKNLETLKTRGKWRE